MAAPTPVARGTPAGAAIQDGFSTTVSFTGYTSISFWEVTVQPPGIDGGDAVNTTTMLNGTWRTMAPRQLKTLTEAKCNGAYNDTLYTSIVAMINDLVEITVAFPNGKALTFWGYLKSFEPGEIQEDEQPRADFVIQPTNFDGSAEQGPVVGTAP